MMKKRKLVALVLGIVMVLGLLAACGGKSSSYMATPAEESAAGMTGENGSFSLRGDNDSGNTSAQQPPSDRKWIITVNMEAEVEDLSAALEAVQEKVAALNGYMEDQSVNNGSAYSSSRYRRASLTVRIPADQVDSFTGDISGIANVVSMSKSLTDITLNYVSTENRIKALETEQARLLELLSMAENMSDLLEIEDRLTDVRYELENYASRLRVYDNQVDYATIYLNLKQVQEYTPVEEPTTWERIRDGFTGSIKGLGESLTDLLVFVIVASPFLVVYGIIVAVIIFVVRKIRAKRKAKKAAKAENAKKTQE